MYIYIYTNIIYHSRDASLPNLVFPQNQHSLLTDEMEFSSDGWLENVAKNQTAEHLANRSTIYRSSRLGLKMTTILARYSTRRDTSSPLFTPMFFTPEHWKKISVFFVYEIATLPRFFYRRVKLGKSKNTKKLPNEFAWILHTVTL